MSSTGHAGAGTVAPGYQVVTIDHQIVGHVFAVEPDRFVVDDGEQQLAISFDAVYLVSERRVELLCDLGGLRRYVPPV